MNTSDYLNSSLYDVHAISLVGKCHCEISVVFLKLLHRQSQKWDMFGSDLFMYMPQDDLLKYIFSIGM